MITRSGRTVGKMDNCSEAKRTEAVEISNESVNDNYQLGVQDVVDDVTTIDVGHSNLQARGRNQPSPQTNDFERMFILLQSMKEGNEEAIKSLREDNAKTREETKVAIQEVRMAIQEEMKELREENARMHEETKKEIRQIEADLRAEMQEMRRDFSAEIKIIQQENERSNEEMKENREEITRLKVEVANNNQKIITNTQKLSENLNRINTELRSEIKSNKEETSKVKKHQEEIENQVKQMGVEKKKRIDEMKEEHEQLKRRILEVEGRPTHRGNTLDIARDVTFNGIDSYPMEFLKELREIKEEYYSNEDIKWVSKHLIDEAKIWYRIIQGKINNFNEFEENFIEKYWGQHTQEGIRDKLEFGRYRTNGKLNMIQYLERNILQCRQLVPPLSDRHLIRKLASHYTRDIEVAVLTRGIKEIPQFVALLHEYANINNNGHEKYRQNNNNYVAFKQEGNERYNGEQVNEKGRFERNKYNGSRKQEKVEQITVTAGPSGVNCQSKNESMHLNSKER